MGSKKIIVPQGLINPNETTIIEIPAGVDSEATLIARSSPRTCQDMFQPGHTSTPRTRRVTTVPPARPQSACGAGGGGGGGGGGRQVRQVTSTTIISNEDDSSSLGILDSNYMNSTGRSGGRSGQQSSLGVLGSGYMDSTCPASRNTTMGILGSGYMDSTRMSDNGGNCMGGNYADSGRSNNTMGILGSGYMDSTRSTNQSSLGVLGSGYMDSTRSTNQSSLGILGSGYMDCSRSPSPKRVKKIVKKVVTETPHSSNNSNSLGILPNSYMNDTNLNLCNRSGGGNESKKKVTRVTSETIIDEGDSQESAGVLGSGYFDSTQSSGASRSMGLLPGAYLDSPQQSAQDSSNSCPSRRGRRCPGSAGSNRSQGGNSTQQNLTMEVQRHLSELEQNERNQINRDLVMFQQARRRLVHDATNISSSGESQMNFGNNNKHM